MIASATIAKHVLATNMFRTVGPRSACRASRAFSTIWSPRFTAMIDPFRHQEKTRTSLHSFPRGRRELYGPSVAPLELSPAPRVLPYSARPRRQGDRSNGSPICRDARVCRGPGRCGHPRAEGTVHAFRYRSRTGQSACLSAGRVRDRPMDPVHSLTGRGVPRQFYAESKLTSPAAGPA
jgi:hypothetical protein